MHILYVVCNILMNAKGRGEIPANLGRINKFFNYQRGHGLTTGRAEPSLTNKGFTPPIKGW